MGYITQLSTDSLPISSNSFLGFGKSLDAAAQPPSSWDMAFVNRPIGMTDFFLVRLNKTTISTFDLRYTSADFSTLDFPTLRMLQNTDQTEIDLAVNINAGFHSYNYLASGNIDHYIWIDFLTYNHVRYSKDASGYFFDIKINNGIAFHIGNDRAGYLGRNQPLKWHDSYITLAGEDPGAGNRTAGDIWYDSNSNVIKYWNGTAVKTIATTVKT